MQGLIKKLQQHISKMCKGQSHLFVVDADPDEVWETYLESFPAGTNEIFRKRREYDCSCCRHFIRDMGRVVALKDGKMISIWDFDADSSTYSPVVNALSELIHSHKVCDVFVPIQNTFGTPKSKELLDSGDVITYQHLHAGIAGVTTYDEKNVGTVQGRMRENAEVLQRSFELISFGALNDVLELIAQNSLYRGEEWKNQLKTFLDLKTKYTDMSFCWEQSTKISPTICKIKNGPIGALLLNLSEGMDLNDAVTRYEKMVAPTNYKRPKAIYTKATVELAEKKLKELGFENSLQRRFATIDDITVNNVIFANRDAKRRMAKSLLDILDPLPVDPKKFNKVEQVSIDTFVNEILPHAQDISVLVEDSHKQNFVSLIAPVENSKSMFKWNNNFSWAYEGNITDSMKENVKKFGGKVDGVLRFSIQWNDNDDNHDDLDAHCTLPGCSSIYYAHKRDSTTGGGLDVDIIRPDGVAVENITWPKKSKMRGGRYAFFVHCYNSKGAKSGFSAEIEFDDKIHSFTYPQPLRQGEKVHVADVDFMDYEFTIKKHLNSSQNLWDLSTDNFHKVSVITQSPNYWDVRGVGNKHYFFMLEGCKNPSNPSGFFNEFLCDELTPHRKVLEALSSKMRVKDSDEQLSGLGFSSTKRAEVVVKVTGNFERVLKVTF